MTEGSLYSYSHLITQTPVLSTAGYAQNISTNLSSQQNFGGTNYSINLHFRIFSYFHNWDDRKYTSVCDNAERVIKTFLYMFLHGDVGCGGFM